MIEKSKNFSEKHHLTEYISKQNWKGREGGKQNREYSVRLRRKEKWNGEAGRDYIANIVQKEGTAKSSP